MRTLALLALAARVAAAAPCATTGDFARPGPYGVGVRTFTFVDTTRPTPANRSFPGAPVRTLTTEVWYPATAGGAAAPARDAPLAATAAPYPLLVHGHASLDVRTGESYLTTHLASHGFVVAAPDFPLAGAGAPGGPSVDDVAGQAGDVRVVVDRVLGLAADPTSPLAGAADAARVGASGLSFGAITMLLATYHRDLRDARIRAVLPIAPPFACALERSFFATAAVPLLVLQGTDDRLVSPRENAGRVLARARGPRQLVLVHRGSHLGFIGFATALDPAQHPDRVGCVSLLAAFGPDPSIPLPGGAAAGIAPDPGRVCPRACRHLPVKPALGAARQHALAEIVAAAFFDSALRDDARARCFLRHRLARENRDVTTVTRGR